MQKIKWGWSVEGVFIVLYHLILLVAVPWYFLNFSLSWGLALATFVILSLTMLSITMGYHRLYAHKTYKASKWVEIPLLIFGTLAAQSSVLQWSYDHRQHHNFTDTDKDPYTIKKGFWYAHVLWLYDKNREPIKNEVVTDLMKNKLVMFQHKYYGLLFVAMSVGVSLLLGFAFADMVGAFVIGWGLRVFISHHCTWFINSLAHTVGARPYSKEQSAVDNALVALFTFGEGYHNYHHAFPIDYRNGVKWYHFDPSKWLIWTLSKLKLAKGLVKINKYTMKRRILHVDKTILLEKLKENMYVKKEVIETKIHEYSEKITDKISKFQALVKEYRTSKKNKAPKHILTSLRKQIRSLKKTISHDLRAWRKFSYRVMNLRPRLDPQPF